MRFPFFFRIFQIHIKHILLLKFHPFCYPIKEPAGYFLHQKKFKNNSRNPSSFLPFFITYRLKRSIHLLNTILCSWYKSSSKKPFIMDSFIISGLYIFSIFSKAILSPSFAANIKSLKFIPIPP